MKVEIKSQIAGAFEGWSGDTLFELTNGQIWKQAHYKYRYYYKYRPQINIIRDGSRYFLSVNGIDEMLEVKRIH